jgi:hypothetical protein
MLEQAATNPAVKCSNRWQHIRLQHARTGGNMSGCNMFKQAATYPAATCSNRWQHVWLQHARTGGNMSGCNIMLQVVTTSQFYGLLDDIFVAQKA